MNENERLKQQMEGAQQHEIKSKLQLQQQQQQQQPPEDGTQSPHLRTRGMYQKSQSFYTSSIRRKRLDSHELSLGGPLPRHPSHESRGIVPKSKSFDKSSSVNSSSRNSKVSKTSSILTPRFMPWAFSNISPRLIPSDVEELPLLDVSHAHNNNGHDPSKQRSGSNSAVVTADSSTHHENHHDNISSRHEHSNHATNDRRRLGGKQDNMFQQEGLLLQGTLKNMDKAGRVDATGYLPGTNSSAHSLKYSSHHVDEKEEEEEHDDDDYDSLSLTHKTTDEFHHDNYELPHIDRQFRSYPLDTIYHHHRFVDKNIILQSKTPPAHERSRSVDYLEDGEEHKFPSLLRSLSEVLKSPPRYGSTNTFTPYKYDEHEEEEEGDSMVFSPLVVSRSGGASNRQKSGRTLTSTPESDHGLMDDKLMMDPIPPRKKRSMRRRIYVLLTDPHSSILSALTTAVIFFMIICSNIVMVLQTLDQFEYTPSKCRFCDEYFEHMETDDMITNRLLLKIPKCECPPRPIPPVAQAENFIMCFFAAEWLMRLFTFEPLRGRDDPPRTFLQSFYDFYFEPHSVMDLLAFLPYFVEKYAARDTFMSFRLMRIFRVFQLIRLGQYNVTFCTLVNVLISSLPSINMLGIALIFGGVFFGTVVYWLERGEWKYTELLDPPEFAHVRIGKDGLTEELSPFRSIPGSFWWFIVTVTTVGYGDMVPTSALGKMVGSCAMLVGVLVIAFPVSVFSELWSKELEAHGAYRSPDDDDDDDISTRDEDFENVHHSLEHDMDPPKIISAVVDTSQIEDYGHSVSHEEPSVHSIVFKPRDDPPFSPQVEMDMTNLQAIRHYMSVIDDAQQKIKTLLEKIDATESRQ